MTTLWPLLCAVVRRDLRLTARRGADLILPPLFFLSGAALFALAVGPYPALLGRIAPGVIWVLALLAALQSLERLFTDDWRDGTLELICFAPAPLALLTLVRILTHSVLTAAPLLALTPLLAVMLAAPLAALPTLLLGLALGLPTVLLAGAVMAALTLGARRAAALLPLLTAPLAAPPLIFGVAAATAAGDGLSVQPHLLLLGAMLAAALPLAPWAAAAGLRQALE